MLTPTSLTATLALASTVAAASSSLAATCTSTLSASHAAPSVAAGYVARLVANNLKKPRSILFDKNDNLLVVEAGTGISSLSFTESGPGTGCFTAGDKRTVIADTSLNHGIALSEDGKTLYASSADEARSWGYDASKGAVTEEDSKLLVGNMAGTDHTTRTLLLPKHAPGMLVVCRGSVSNIDPAAADIESGHSQIKAFDIANATRAYDYTADGVLMGWGLRNEVGIDEEPTTGGIYGVENSVDQMMREGKDVHQNNPGEELNFLGYLNGTKSPNQGRNFGYPSCFSAWTPSDLPDFKGKVGEQFAIGSQNATLNDTTCDATNKQPPRLVFQAHMAPLDILFNPTGTAAWITFHGSWNRDTPVGYKLSVVAFAGGEPTAPSDSKTAAIDIVANVDNSKCPDECFRPVGLAWDSKGNLFMSSDATGEVYAVLRADGGKVSEAGSNATGTIPSPTGAAPPGATTPSTGVKGDVAGMSLLAVLFGVVAFAL